MNIEQHKDLKAIRELKSRYFRYMDTQDWELWADCFTSDVSATFEGSPRSNSDQPHVNQIDGRDALVSLVSKMMVDTVTVHQGSMPDIEFISETTASGVWSMLDIVRFPTAHFKGWGHYYDNYVKEDGQWKIKKTHLY